MMVVGDKEIESGSLNLRKHGEKQTQSLMIDEVVALFETLQSEMLPEKYRL